MTFCLNLNYMQLVKNIIRSVKGNTHMQNKHTFWDYLKCEIRSQTMIYSRKRPKTLRKDEE